MSVREALSRANPNALADHFRNLDIGQILSAGIPVYRRKFSFVAGGTSARHVATLQHMALDPKAKATSILRATVRAGGVTGELTPVAFGATPATTQIGVAPNGDIVALAADAITDVDVVYVGDKTDSVELVLPVNPATGVALIPSKYTALGIVLLHSANATVGTVTGEKRVLVPGAVNPATPQVRLDVAKTQVQFTVADAVSRATVVLCFGGKDTYAQLLAAEQSV